MSDKSDETFLEVTQILSDKKLRIKKSVKKRSVIRNFLVKKESTFKTDSNKKCNKNDKSKTISKN